MTNEIGKRNTIGYTQQAILTSLSSSDRTVRTLADDWPWLTAGATRSALDRLYERGLVEPARWDGPSREWTITVRGQEALDQVGELEE